MAPDDGGFAPRGLSSSLLGFVTHRRRQIENENEDEDEDEDEDEKTHCASDYSYQGPKPRCPGHLIRRAQISDQMPGTGTG